MATLSKKNFSNPDEKMTPEKTDMRIDIIAKYIKNLKK